MELGSEFNIRLEELEETQNSIYHRLKNYNSCYLDSGRSAIKLILKELKMGEVLLPEYICDSVIQAFLGFDIKFYRLKEDLTIDLDDLHSRVNDDTRVVYLMHYFGVLQPEKILEQVLFIKNQNNFIIIEDTTHSLFSKLQTIGDYCVCSLRKWFAIPDGGVLYSKNSLECCNLIDLKTNKSINKAYGMILKTLYLVNEIEVNLLYRKIFIDAEKEIDENEEIKKISKFSEYLLKCYNVSYLITKRKENYAQLLREIVAIGLKPIVEIEEACCPFVLPISIDKRDDLRAYLEKNKVYCAIHWPLEKTSLYENLRSRNMSMKILSLPIDQRYGTYEISYLISVLKDYGES
ncbi:hypothetical protein GH808_11340 [Acetobacterium fimetarium]|uniref:dTDP-4-amino-4,6-dideoxygalactose transaminase n=1 Tax=Acetobacterium fimetarium TaxID=52691 RepID=A0ABR6WWR2_9FIRM|nr:DegT/DnrJ/EryC1/StrS family aminotransferase [Acetobacterium fimetarium]MBC3805025.1 hypothetical protein [Acetobacterium fimetarium]